MTTPTTDEMAKATQLAVEPQDTQAATPDSKAGVSTTDDASGGENAGSPSSTTDDASGGGEKGKRVEADQGAIAAEDMELATTFGLSEDDAKELGPRGVARFLAAMTREVSRFAGRSGGDSGGDEGPGPKDGPKAKPQEPWKFKTKLTAGPDGYEPDFLAEHAEIGGKVEAHEAAFHALTNKVEELTQYIEGQRIQALEERFDAALAGMPDCEELFGKGPGAKMDRNAVEFKNRAAVWDTMLALQEGYKSRGRKINEQSLIRLAVMATMGDRVQALTRKQIGTQMQRDATGRFLARPAGRKADAQDGRGDPEKSAVQAVRQKLQEFGADET